VKLTIINKIQEDRKIAQLAILIEDIFGDDDLDPVEDSFTDGIHKLQLIANGDGDQLTSGEVKLAALAFRDLNKLLISSKDQLAEQLKINQLIGRKH
jgi:hypothetical protein